jgi:hypothetical protein
VARFPLKEKYEALSLFNKTTKLSLLNIFSDFDDLVISMFAHFHFTVL